MNDVFFRILATAVGSLLGFLLGLLAMRIKEWRDRQSRIKALNIGTSIVATQLSSVLHEDPKICGWLKAEALLQFQDVFDNQNAPVAMIDDLLSIYSQWSRGFFLAGGIRAADCASAKAELDRISYETKKRFLDPGCRRVPSPATGRSSSAGRLRGWRG